MLGAIIFVLVFVLCYFVNLFTTFGKQPKKKVTFNEVAFERKIDKDGAVLDKSLLLNDRKK